MSSEEPRPEYFRHRQRAYTLRPVSEEQDRRWQRRLRELGESFSEWVRRLLDRDCEGGQ